MQTESLQQMQASADFALALGLAREKLSPAPAADGSLKALAAAAFFAISALTFCAAAVLAPPNVTTPMARAGVR